MDTSGGTREGTINALNAAKVSAMKAAEIDTEEGPAVVKKQEELDTDLEKLYVADRDSRPTRNSLCLRVSRRWRYQVPGMYTLHWLVCPCMWELDSQFCILALMKTDDKRPHVLATEGTWAFSEISIRCSTAV